MDECEKFTGRMRDLCSGHGGDGRGHPPRESVVAFRDEYKLPPLVNFPDPTYPSIISTDGTVTTRCCSGSLQPHGPGTELKLLIAWFGYKAGSNCKCTEHANQMDNMGIAWCEENTDTIVEWIEEAAKERSILGFSLDRVPGFEFGVRKLIGQAIENAKKSQRNLAFAPFQFTKGLTPRFVTTADLMKDAHRLANMLPPDTPFIIGVARSGLCVASMVSMLLHLPLHVYGQSTATLTSPGNGWRLTGNVGGRQGKPVVIDDTVMTGNSFKSSLPVIRKTFPTAISAAVYCNPNAEQKPDIWVEDLPWPHLLEWNLFNSVLCPSMAYDFDGILCRDCRPEEDDDGPRYLEFLRDATPLYLTRKDPISMIVTARLEKYRPQTLEWLARHGVTVQTLIMGPWANNHDRAIADVSSYKARHFKEFMKRHHQVKPSLFIESEAFQAERIAKLSGGVVVCPAAGRCFT